ncbi:hypothetical protein [Rickettsia endosymbiont of Orchestes rusci]
MGNFRKESGSTTYHIYSEETQEILKNQQKAFNQQFISLKSIY